MGTGQHLQANNVFNQQHDAGAVHRPEIDGGSVCFSKVQTSLGSAAHHQVQWHHARPVYSYCQVVNPGKQVYEILGILDTRPLSFPPNQVPRNRIWFDREDKSGGSPGGRDRGRDHGHRQCARWSCLWTGRGKEGWEDAGLSQPDTSYRTGEEKNNFVDVPANSQMRKSN